MAQTNPLQNQNQTPDLETTISEPGITSPEAGNPATDTSQQISDLSDILIDQVLDDTQSKDFRGVNADDVAPIIPEEDDSDDSETDEELSTDESLTPVVEESIIEEPAPTIDLGAIDLSSTPAPAEKSSTTEEIPTEQETQPDIDLSNISLDENPMPVVEEAVPVVEEAVPVVEEAVPVVEEAVPVIEEPVPVVEEEPVVEDLPEIDLPTVEEPAPVVEEQPVIEDLPEIDLPVIEEPAPVVEEVEPVVEESQEAPVIDVKNIVENIEEPTNEEPAPVVEEQPVVEEPTLMIDEPNTTIEESSDDLSFDLPEVELPAVEEPAPVVEEQPVIEEAVPVVEENNEITAEDLPDIPEPTNEEPIVEPVAIEAVVTPTVEEPTAGIEAQLENIEQQVEGFDLDTMFNGNTETGVNEVVGTTQEGAPIAETATTNLVMDSVSEPTVTPIENTQTIQNTMPAEVVAQQPEINNNKALVKTILIGLGVVAIAGASYFGYLTFFSGDKTPETTVGSGDTMPELPGNPTDLGEVMPELPENPTDSGEVMPELPESPYPEYPDISGGEDPIIDPNTNPTDSGEVMPEEPQLTIEGVLQDATSLASLAKRTLINATVAKNVGLRNVAFELQKQANIILEELANTTDMSILQTKADEIKALSARLQAINEQLNVATP